MIPKIGFFFLEARSLKHGPGISETPHRAFFSILFLEMSNSGSPPVEIGVYPKGIVSLVAESIGQQRFASVFREIQLFASGLARLGGGRNDYKKVGAFCG